MCPSIVNEPSLPQLSTVQIEEGIYQSQHFEFAQFEVSLKNAIYALKKAGLYENAVDVNNILVGLYRAKRDFLSMQKCFIDMRTNCDLLVASNIQQSRIFSSYFRVAFYGSGW